MYKPLLIGILILLCAVGAYAVVGSDREGRVVSGLIENIPTKVQSLFQWRPGAKSKPISSVSNNLPQIPKSSQSRAISVDESLSKADSTPVVAVVNPATLSQITSATDSKHESESKITETPTVNIVPPPEKSQSQSLYGGYRSDGGSQSVDDARSALVPTETETPVEEKRVRVGGQARGYAILSLMQPEARASAARMGEILLESEINELYLSVLVDGTFSENFPLLESAVRALNVGGRSLTLVQYLSSGPTMRNHERTPIRTVFSVINPLDFRFMIESDSSVRNETVRIATEARKVFELNRSLNARNQNFVVVMLEDNLDSYSYGVMRRLVAGVIGETAEFIRNPCPDCGIEGSDANTLGDRLEVHDPAEFGMLTSRDGFTLDGKGLAYPGETALPHSTIPEVENLLDRALANRIAFFGLWRSERQGGRNQLIHPDNRIYEIPTDEQAKVEIELLRRGLLPVETSSVD